MASKAFSASLSYGLNVKGKGQSKKNGPAVSKSAAAAFGDDSDDDGDGVEVPAKERSGRAGVNYMMLKEATKNKSNKKTQQAWQAAVAENSTVFQYDEVYDELEQTKTVEALRRQEAKAADKRPKYIDALMENAKRKKLQDELRDERQAQKEREREGAEFAEKDVFVTGAYKKKLIELKKAAEEDRQKELEEQRNDVTKRSDLSDLYRNMFKNKLTGGSGYAQDSEGEGGAASVADSSSMQQPHTYSASESQEAAGGRLEQGSPVRDESVAEKQHRADPISRERGGERKQNGGASPGRRDNRSPQETSQPLPPPTRKREFQEGEKDDESKHARKSTENDVQDAKARYLARKAAREARKLATFDA